MRSHPFGSPARGLAALALVSLALLGSPAAAAEFTVPGTDGDDEITINGSTGEILVNEEDAILFNAKNDRFIIEAGAGADTITVSDVKGNSRYGISTGDGADTVTVTDGAGNDRYAFDGSLLGDTLVITDGAGNDRYEGDLGSGNDSVTLQDGAGNDRYEFDLDADDDNATVNDASGNDRYDLSTGDGEDDVIVADGPGNDQYLADLGNDDDALAFTDSAGNDCGRMIWKRMRSSLAPSSRAASETSCEICMKNCRSRKIQNGLPKKSGTVSGQKVLIHPSRAKMSKRAMIRTGYGMNTVASTTMNTLSRPGQSMREKP